MKELRFRVGDENLSGSLKAVNGTRSRPRVRGGRSPGDQPLMFSINWWQPPDDITTSWQDSAGAPLEGQIDEICMGLLVAGEWAYRCTLIRRHEWHVERRKELEEKLLREKEEALRKKREAEKRLEQRRVNHLLAAATGWKQAAEIRGFVTEVQRRVLATESVDVFARIEPWLVWARHQAERLDPLSDSQFTDWTLEILELHAGPRSEANEAAEPSRTTPHGPHETR